MPNKREKSLLEKQQFDIRITKNGRWYDQKVTPDVMSVICHTIIKYCNGEINKKFTARDLWQSDTFTESMESDFGKPHPQNKGAKNEYDKFISQPLNVLCVAGVIKKEDQPKIPHHFVVCRKFVSLLNRMAVSERESIEFLDFYISKTIKASSLKNAFDEFFEKQNEDCLDNLKDKYQILIKDNTGIRHNTEIKRIFPKVLNIQAYSKRSKGIIRGRLSKHIISLSDIRYNRMNWRDIARGKPKGVPRKQQKEKSSDIPDSSRATRNVIQDVKDHHKKKPEIQDSFSNLPDNTQNSVEGHHIFPRSKYPVLQNYRENIILLTPTQHKCFAHTKGNENISRFYQYLCLQKKLDSVEKCDSDVNCNFYSLRDFQKMLHIAGKLDKQKSKKLETFDDIRRILAEHYVGA